MVPSDILISEVGTPQLFAPNAADAVETLSVYAVKVVESEAPFTVVARLVIVYVSVIVVLVQGFPIVTEIWLESIVLAV